MDSFGETNRIAGNQLAEKLQDNLNRINQKATLSRLKLATGKRINEAADGSADFVIGRSLQARNKGLATALNNVGDARSTLSMAEGGLGSVLDLLGTMKERATRAASDTLSEDDRQIINQELQALADEIDDIVSQTDYNGKKLLQGLTLSVQSGEQTTDAENVEVTGEPHDAGSLGVSGTDIDAGTADTASDALSRIEAAAGKVMGSMASIGASQSRLSATEDRLVAAITNTEAARSRIMDTDMAKEQIEAFKQQLQQDVAVAAGAHVHASAQAVAAL